jgi:hypothetical protein
MPQSNPEYEKFLELFRNASEVYGVLSDPNISHYAELLCSAVERKVFNTQRGETTNKKLNPRKTFIAIFMNRFLIATDLTHPPIKKPSDFKIIDYAIENLTKHGATVEMYLDWVFGDMLDENPKFNPPSIGLICSNSIVMKYLVSNKDKLDEIKKKEASDKDINDTMSLARSIIREQDDDELRQALKKVADGDMEYQDFKNMVLSRRKTVKPKEPKKMLSKFQRLASAEQI